MSESSTHARALALADEAAFDFAMGDEVAALTKLQAAVSADPACFEAWLAKAEVHFASGQYDEALAAG
ncbi:MAG: tetratricopeptide repeat protein, partial [Opitutales bacterium]|nr:tetratricopeptide repeat protein [Opitutales bacterium]